MLHRGPCVLLWVKVKPGVGEWPMHWASPFSSLPEVSCRSDGRTEISVLAMHENSSQDFTVSLCLRRISTQRTRVEQKAFVAIVLVKTNVM